MQSPRVLRLTSCQSENSEHIGRALAAYLEQRTGIETEFVDGIPWQERERKLDEGTIHAGWICGLPYVRKADRRSPGIELLAAPVMTGARYGGRPVYYSDIVVRRGHPARSFEDLRGARWGYNEPGSHSGYNLVRYQLARRGERQGYFSEAVETGSHQQTLCMLLAGTVDASAIDSTVLETELRRQPALRHELRVVETWGPSPAPPWVVSSRVPARMRTALRGLFLDMHRDPDGKGLLRRSRMKRFAAVSSRSYDPIRKMASIAGDVVL